MHMCRENLERNLTIYHIVSHFNLCLFTISVNLNSRAPFGLYSEITWQPVDSYMVWLSWACPCIFLSARTLIKSVPRKICIFDAKCFGGSKIFWSFQIGRIYMFGNQERKLISYFLINAAKDVHMFWKYQKTLKSGMYSILNHCLIHLRHFTNVG